MGGDIRLASSSPPICPGSCSIGSAVRIGGEVGLRVGRGGEICTDGVADTGDPTDGSATPRLVRLGGGSVKRRAWPRASPSAP